VRLFFALTVTFLIISPNFAQSSPLNTASLILQGVRFYFSLSVPSEISVESTGTGPTREKAIDNALIAAVQQAIGVLVVSDITVESNKVVRDIAINYASGVVKEYFVKQCIDSVRVQCTINAKVSPTAFQQKLLQSSSVTKVDGENLYAQHLTQKNTIIQRRRLANYYLTQTKKNGFDLRLISVNSIPTTTEDIKLQLVYEISWNNQFKINLINFLRRIEKDTEGGYENYDKSSNKLDFIVIPVHGRMLSFKPADDFIYIRYQDYELKAILEFFRTREFALPVSIKPFNFCYLVIPPDGGIFKIDHHINDRERTHVFQINADKLKNLNEINIEFGCAIPRL